MVMPMALSMAMPKICNSSNGMMNDSGNTKRNQKTFDKSNKGKTQDIHGFP